MMLTKHKSPLAVKIGHRIQQVRQAAGDTQEELAAATKLSRAQIASYELGNANAPLPAILAIARHYGVSLATFEPERPPVPPPSEEEQLSRQLARDVAGLPPPLTLALLQLVDALRSALGGKA